MAVTQIRRYLWRATSDTSRRLTSNCWDETYGGFYREGTSIGRAEDMRKEWWVQMEGLNALLLMHEKYGRQRNAYFKAFQQDIHISLVGYRLKATGVKCMSARV